MYTESTHTSHDITEKIKLHGNAEEMVDDRGFNSVHALQPCITEPLCAAINAFLDHICTQYSVHYNMTRCIYSQRRRAFCTDTMKYGLRWQGNSLQSTRCPTMCASLTFTAHHGLCGVLLLCAVACSCKILTKGIIAILAHDFIPDALELFTHVLCFSLELYTVSLM